MAITRAVSASLAQCELTHLSREPLDVRLAERQHAAYEDALARLGATLIRAEAAPELPDAVFIEDTAVVLPELAIVTRPGAASRRGETAAVRSALMPYRTVAELEAPATLDGGDVLRLGHTLYVGASTRSNEAGIEALARLVEPHGYSVVVVAFSGCLHLKSAATTIGENAVVLNPAWVSDQAFGRAEAVVVDPDEPYAANVLLLRRRAIHGAEYPETRARLEAYGLDVTPVACSELAKAEGAVTCCSLVFEE